MSRRDRNCWTQSLNHGVVKSRSATPWGARIVGLRTPRILILLAFLVVALGIPLPTFEADLKDFSVPFPCQYRPCGCQDAHTCWTRCCCFSASERVVWALANDVPIPEYAVLPAPAEMARLLANHQRVRAGAIPTSFPATCCNEGDCDKPSVEPSTKPTCCCSCRCAKPGANAPPARTPNEVSDDSAKSVKTKHRANTNPSANAGKRVSGITAAKCQGTSWGKLLICSLPVTFFTWNFAIVTVPFDGSKQPHWDADRAAPPLPPPR